MKTGLFKTTSFWFIGVFKSIFEVRLKTYFKDEAVKKRVEAS